MGPDRALLWRLYAAALGRRGRVSQQLEALEKAFALNPTSHATAIELVQLRPRGPAPDRFGFIAIGTTGLCNASCIHCPTGKASTAHVPRVPMEMPLFRRVIDEIGVLRFPISGQIALGLFGDGLVDPHVVERVQYLRRRFPSTPVSINTNGAAFNLQRHEALRDLDVIIGLHCESIVAASFNLLMQPLRLERVIPKYEQMLDLFGNRVHVSIPLSRANVKDAAETRTWFQERGAHVMLAPLASRCADDRSVFNALAFRPLPMRCGSQVLDDLIIDCDGTVLRCCQDFRRAEPIGNLAAVSLRSVLFGAERRSHADFLDQGRHAESPTCSRCFADNMHDLEAHLTEHAGD